MEGILLEIVKGIFGLLALVAGMFATVAIKRIMSKYGLELSEKREAQTRQIAQNSILYAEEWAANKFKLEETLISGEEKMRIAMQKLLEKVPGIDAGEAKEIITEELPKLGHGAASLIESISRKIAENPEKLKALEA